MTGSSLFKNPASAGFLLLGERRAIRGTLPPRGPYHSGATFPELTHSTTYSNVAHQRQAQVFTKPEPARASIPRSNFCSN